MTISLSSPSKTYVVGGQKLYAVDYDAMLDVIIANNAILAAKCVDNESDQPIAGVKTFSAIPVFSAGANMGDAKVTNVLDPTAAQDAATKAYVDDNVGVYAPTVATGYTGGQSITFPNGLIIKTDYVAISATSGTVIYDDDFPTEGTTITAMLRNGSSTSNSITIVGGPSTTGFSWAIDDSNMTGFYYMAIGY